MDSMGADVPAKPGFYLGLLNSVENNWNPPRNDEAWTFQEDSEAYTADNETSLQTDVLSVPNMRVSLDDFTDSENEAQSELPVIRSIDQTTGECSEQYEQDDENIFSSFTQKESAEVSSINSCVLEGENTSPMEKSTRDYCKDSSVEMFQPKNGMTFDSLADAYQFYNSYSWVKGFSIRRGDSYTNTKKVRTMQELICQHAGRNKNPKLSTTLCGCKAYLKVCLNDHSKWYVKAFSEDHNHELVESCGEKQHLFSHQHIDQPTKDIIRYLRENNVSLSRVDCIMGSFFGSADKVPFSKKSLRTVCSRIAKESLKDDIIKTMESFRDMIAKDEKFVFSAQLDDDNGLKLLMWTSGRSRSLYEFFGDAITFDTTYETNIYKMPFGMFVGVSNHFESVIFAGVLLSNEKEGDFKWAFKQFVAMMGGKPPVTMLTDQAKAMMIAIKDVLPHTNHRWCKWHVLRKAKEVLGHVYKKYDTFSDDFHKLVNHMLTVEEFEEGWRTISEKYNLQENPFMIRAFQCRKKWAKPYFQGIFCARMASTQRSESANHVLKIYIPCNSGINRFVAQYSKLISDRERCDHECEKNTKQVFINRGICRIPECHIMKRWTRQARMTKFDPNIKNLGKDRRVESRAYRHKIVYMGAMELVNQAELDEKTCEIANRNIDRAKKEIEEYMLSKRTNIQVGYGDCSGTSNPVAAEMPAAPEDMIEDRDDGLEILDRAKKISIPVASIQAPLIKKKNGRQTNKRLMSRLDGNINKKKRGGKAKRSNVPGGRSGLVQSRFCTKCQSPAHNITTCPQRLEDDGIE